ncbi:uncharacterized protein LACBIDRAFT_291657 [Laccaria bicolor S238N-H82]|uniref:Predicted protein n=1 Tax=Laccaria bicolor (strain S238N-H82 / ATCC MYA-4686) TaxID=486041 RepID=B0CR74_LACBS|nr:uncharacterized protein LACBIDRAFT_291657 [Laccaria bicolor S238N-H82]EDR15152.1 predicted protein [Laccaria bicolor S238N-H82]|eukprot:XP_001873360.1 predicted protein [Laccaria bicolor S238N-H82]
MLAFIFALFVALQFLSVFAAPAPYFKARDITALSNTDISDLSPFTQLARASYCPTAKLQGWKCGKICDSLPGFEPTLIGGDGITTQIYFVGYWPDQNTIVVSHEGTDPIHLASILTDIKITMHPLNATLFPGVSSAVLVHDGFKDQHAITAQQILAEVQSLMASKNSTSVTLVGHSLGGALAVLDALYMNINLPAGTSIKAVTYGTPRIGNAAFAQLIDEKIPDLRRINNKFDIIPTVPGRFLGYAHPHGEVHLLSTGTAISCPGSDDSTDSRCQNQSVPNVLKGNILDHLGPYVGLSIGTIFCV